MIHFLVVSLKSELKRIECQQRVSFEIIIEMLQNSGGRTSLDPSDEDDLKKEFPISTSSALEEMEHRLQNAANFKISVVRTNTYVV